MMWAKKIKAGALQFVLFVGAIIAILLLSFVLVSYSHTLFKKKTDVTIALIQATDKGFQNSFGGLTDQNNPFGNNDGVDLNILTNIQKKYWGIVELRTVTSQKGKLSFTKTGLIGHAEENRPALYLTDKKRPLVVAGNAKITGTARLPEQGIKMGSIGGFTYSGSQLIYGQRQRSTPELPRLIGGITQSLKAMTHTSFIPDGLEIQPKRGMVLKNSFTEETQTIKGHTLDLAQIELSGNIIVWATHKITVHSSARLKDIVLVAPNIEIREGVQGNFQALANNRIHVERNTFLEYPTVLAVHKQNTHTEEKYAVPNILLEKGALVSGTLLYLDENETKPSNTHIKIEEGATVKGEVYCAQSLELKGRVHGSVTTNAFVAHENGNIYLNHLFNGHIDASMLPPEYAGLCPENAPTHKVLKWLY